MKALIIDRGELEGNINIIKAMAKSQIMAVLKGNGYGLSIIHYAQILIENGIDFFAVSEVDEALLLRENGITANILLLSSLTNEEEISKLVENDIILSVGSEMSATALNSVAKGLNKFAKAHIKIDTGFGRYGFMPSMLKDLKKLFDSFENINVTGTYSHFSNSFAKNERIVEKQFEIFQNFVQALNDLGFDTGLCHIANSCAFLRFPHMHMDASRIGSAFLGRIPIKNVYNLNKIAYLVSKIDDIKILPKGHFIGYANTFKTKKEMRIAIVPVGYKDGFGLEKAKDTFRFIDFARDIYHSFKKYFLQRGIFVSIGNSPVKLVGRISMYNIICDVSDINAQIGDDVRLDVNPILIDSLIKREYI